MTPRGLKIALTASVLVNVFLLAAAGTTGVLCRRELDARLERGAALYAAASKLDPKVQQQLKEAMRAQAPSVRPDFDAARAARRRASQLAGAPVLDRKAVEAALAEGRAAEGRGKVKVEGKLLDFMQSQPDQVRIALAPALAARRLFGPRPDDKGPRDGAGKP
jgi:uncharacterized membrane protein